jgi:hypothetical protein
VCSYLAYAFTLERVIAEDVGSCAASAKLWCSVGRKGEAEFTFDAYLENPRGESIGWVAAAHRNDGVRRVGGEDAWKEVEVLGCV